MILLNFLDNNKYEYIKDNNRYICSKDELIEVLNNEEVAVFDTIKAQELLSLNLKNSVIYDYQTVYILASGILEDFIRDFSINNIETIKLKAIIDKIEGASDILDKMNCIYNYKKDIIDISNISFNTEARNDIDDILKNINILDYEDFIDDLNEIKSIIKETQNRKNIFDRFIVK